MKLVYPACFYEEKEGGYSVEIPDLLGCCTQADTLEEAIEMAEDAALGWILTSIENEEEIPNPSKIQEVKLERENGFVTLLLLDIDQYTEKYGTKKSVKKTLTIPEWLNKRAEKIGVNFSKTLQEALLNKIVNFRKK
ncbi:MAG: HicB family protein [Clostridia bacterium]|nr:HicB family protein [Clostridia bacterium]